MKIDDTPKENPTSQNSETMKVIEQQISFVETFLGEFCKVNGIGANDLKRAIRVKAFPTDSTITVVDAENENDVKFGVKSHIAISEGKFMVNFEVFGEFIEHKDLYPNTTKQLSDGGNTGNSSITSGE